MPAYLAVIYQPSNISQSSVISSSDRTVSKLGPFAWVCTQIINAYIKNTVKNKIYTVNTRN